MDKHLILQVNQDHFIKLIIMERLDTFTKIMYKLLVAETVQIAEIQTVEAKVLLTNMVS